ncbi:MAG: hypothetical protein IKG22_03365 [Atopobiaceae bacterium]|nr:hypothetical protein [Atopobiaceae bacterium]
MAEEITNEEPKKGFDIKNLGMGAWIGIAIAALVVGVLIGHFAMGGAGGAALGKTTLTEAELDTVLGTYTYDGASQSVTAREVIEQGSSLESAKNEEGNYAVPSADSVVSLVRNKIIAKAAEKEGVTVSDEDLSAYAEENLGSSDLASIASSYGMDEAKVKDLLRQTAQMTALRDKVVTADAGEAPEAPEAPEYKTTDDEGNELSDEDKQAAEDEANKAMDKKYAKYIIKLAGDEWDAKANKWKSEDGAYATALSADDIKDQFNKDEASYNAAQAAYYVAYQNYSTAQSQITTQWTDYVNGLLSNASINLSSLIA